MIRRLWLFIHDRLGPERALPLTLKWFIKLQILTSLFWFISCQPVFANEQPIFIPLTKADGGEFGAFLPPANVTILLAVAGQIIWALLKYIFKKKETQDSETVTKLNQALEQIQRLLNLYGKLETRINELPTEKEIRDAMKPEIELIAIKAAKREMGRG